MSCSQKTLESMSPFRFSSKADVLAALSMHEELHIPPLKIITVAHWLEERETVLTELRDWEAHHGTTLAVRSSCHKEDSANFSGAGAFTSLLNIDPRNSTELAAAIDTVIASYGDASPEDQVLLQPMTPHLVTSGVIMTKALTDGAPYYVINYDDESGLSDTITGGKGVSKTVYVFKDAKESDFDSARVRIFVSLARRLEQLCGNDALDIEFGLDKDGILHVFQVRPLCTQAHWIPEAEHHVRDHIDFVADFLTDRLGHWPGLYGQRTILGVMPDWNPAEMIGVTPRPLATSLYRSLITNRVWSQARERMGYRSLPPEELMLLVAGRPYIDVRASFNSFLPANLDRITGEVLVAAWLERLDRYPQWHDKVEFEVAQTALDFCFDVHLDERYPGLLTRARREAFRSNLLQLTSQCLSDIPGNSMNWAFEAVTELQNRQSGRPLAHCRQSGEKPLPLLALLMEECRLYGTLPFSILARHAFIAESLLRTAVERGAIRQERLAEFKRSIQTVSGELSHDFFAVCQGSRDPGMFIQKYGHLRPSTYDLLSPRYADRQGLFVETSTLPLSTPKNERESFSFTASEKQALTSLLQESRLPVEIDQLERYARRAIAGRELAKFIFSRNLSDILEIIARWGERIGLDREALSFLDVRDIMEWSAHALLQSPETYFASLVQSGRRLFDLGRSLKLGYLIRSPRDVYVVPQHRSTPNFVGSRSIESELLRLYPDSPCKAELDGKIICIENADPGFDWIFTRNIAGLVTMFGGTNSHMAIRCAEYGLPAAIGVGEHLFNRLVASRRCRLDAAGAILQPL